MKLLIFSACVSMAPLTALADEALPCDDKRIIARLNSGYSNPEGIAKTRIDKPRELAYGLAPTASRDGFEKARYCEANVVLSNGEADTIYYRLNVLKGGKAQDWVEPCFGKSNAKSMLADGCVDHRPQK
jgi:hypothetical protein